MFILYYLKNFFNLLFFKAFFKYKMSDSFFLVCFIILFSFLCLFFVSIFVTILGRLTIFVFFIFSNFLNLILTLIENWFLKNFFYLIIDLIFFLHRIRFSFFSGVPTSSKPFICSFVIRCLLGFLPKFAAVSFII